MQYNSTYLLRIKIMSRTVSILFLFFFIIIGDIEASEKEGYHIGLTPVILTDRTSFLKEWEEYLAQRLNKPVKFIQRQTYREIIDLLLAGELDAAWLCGYPYVRYRNELKLLAVPLFNGRPLYRSYLIVSAKDTQTSSLLDLKQKVFVYSDPDSNSGFLYPQINLINAGINPRYFFKKTFFAWSHRDVVKAVAEGVAHGGMVDGYVWETLAVNEPELIRRTRVVFKSPEYGFPPLVVRRNLKQKHTDYLQQVLMGMPTDVIGLDLLRRLNLDGFTIGNDELYDRIEDAVKILEGNK